MQVIPDLFNPNQPLPAEELFGRLPTACLQLILKKSGNHTRLVSKLFRHAYSTLPSIRPHHLPDTEALTKAISSSHDSQLYLQDLDLSLVFARVRPHTISAIAQHCKHLQTLNLSDCCFLSPSDLTPLSCLSQSLKTLNLSRCTSLSTTPCPYISPLTALQSLTLTNPPNIWSPLSLHHLAQLRNLTRLVVQPTHRITPAPPPVWTTLATLTRLRHLAIPTRYSTTPITSTALMLQPPLALNTTSYNPAPDTPAGQSPSPLPLPPCGSGAAGGPPLAPSHPNARPPAAATQPLSALPSSSSAPPPPPSPTPSGSASMPPPPLPSPPPPPSPTPTSPPALDTAPPSQVDTAHSLAALAALTALHSLTHLCLGPAETTHDAPLALTALTNLRHLLLPRWQAPALMAQLSKLGGLERLAINAPSPRQVEFGTALTALDFDPDSPMATAPQDFSHLPCRLLSLEYSSPTDFMHPVGSTLRALASTLNSQRHLTRLSLSFTNPFVMPVASLHHLLPRGLVELTLRECDGVDLSDLLQLKKLTLLEIHDDCELDDDNLRYLSNLHSLRRLALTGCSQVTDAGVHYIQTLTNLHSLTLTASNVTSASLTHLPTSLTFLSLDSCGSMDATAILTIQHLLQLQELDFSYCSMQPQDALEHLSQLINLRLLTVTDFQMEPFDKLPLFQPQLLATVLNNCPNLQRLTCATPACFRELCPDLVVRKLKLAELIVMTRGWPDDNQE